MKVNIDSVESAKKAQEIIRKSNQNEARAQHQKQRDQLLEEYTQEREAFDKKWESAMPTIEAFNKEANELASKFNKRMKELDKEARTL
ncbi:hypothetical protein [Enterococcus olivae]